jgi:hypothetical protein
LISSSAPIVAEDKKQEQQPRIITITKCLSEPCAIFYTDTLSQSILIECKDPKHNTDIQKVEGRKANPNLNQTSEQMQSSSGDDAPR